jgi:hypothetical protein
MKSNKSGKRKNDIVVGIAAFLITGILLGVTAFEAESNARNDTGKSYLPLILNAYIKIPTTIHITGRVTLKDGTGVPNIEILSRTIIVSGCSGEVVAITDIEGDYDTYISCPYDHDESMMVCPLSKDFTFEPVSHSWRTYGYCREQHANFIAFSRPIPEPSPIPGIE